MTTFLAFLAAAVMTYALRSCATLAGARLTSSRSLASAVAMVSPAVLTAIVAAALFVERDHVVLPGSFEIAAVGCAVIAVRRTGNVSAALAVGLPVYWLGALLGWV